MCKEAAMPKTDIAAFVFQAGIPGKERYVMKKPITLVLLICMFLSLTNGFKLFDQNLALTGGLPYIINPDGYITHLYASIILSILVLSPQTAGES